MERPSFILWNTKVEAQKRIIILIHSKGGAILLQDDKKNLCAILNVL